MGKAGLNRAIAEQGWHQFKTFLAYKLSERGGELREVDPERLAEIEDLFDIDVEQRRVV